MNGILLVNKPKGMTSHDMVSFLRKKTNIKKIGHTGTLDPMATGVLPICIGKATKVSDYILKSEKEYIAEITFGIKTDSYDITGKVLGNCDKIVELDDLKQVLPNFIGNLKQIPPMYSAIKVGGKKLYEYARAGIEIERKERDIVIYSADILYFQYPIMKLKVLCSAGTYIRSYVNDLGESLGTFATLSELTRTKVSDFSLEKTVTKEELEKMSCLELEQQLIPMEHALMHLKRFNFPKSFYHQALNGSFFPLSEKMPVQFYRLYCEDVFIGIGEIREKEGKQFIKVSKKLVG